MPRRYPNLSYSSIYFLGTIKERREEKYGTSTFLYRYVIYCMEEDLFIVTFPTPYEYKVGDIVIVESLVCSVIEFPGLPSILGKAHILDKVER